MTKFTKISELQAVWDKIERKLPQPPYSAHFSIDSDGHFNVLNDTSLVPEEVERLVRWLIEFYEIEV